MRDVLEEHLGAHLRTLGQTVGDELAPPVDLELQVQRRRRSVRATRRWSSAGIAAAIVVVVAGVAVVRGTQGRGTLRVATSPTTVVPARDSLQPGTVMLSARGRYVISLDASGHTNATMVAAEHGDITYARATDDHRALWYLSLKKGSKECGDVVRADIDGRVSTIVTHAVAFDVSPDGSRLALYGAGDLAHDRCSPVTAAAPGRLVVLDLTTSATSSVRVDRVRTLRWSPDGSYLVLVSCGGACEGFKRIDVPDQLGARLTVDSGPELYPTHTINSASIAFGPDGLYALESTTPIQHASAVRPTDQIDRIDPHSFGYATPVISGGSTWHISQLIPTSSGTYVVARRIPPKGAQTAAPTGLYRVAGGHLVLVRNLVEPGTLTPVTPLAPTG